MEKIYGVNNIFNFKNHRINFLLHNSLKAKNFYKRNVDYVVEKNDKEEKKIVIIDSLTGRLVPNRVYGSGIHQAIESKEELETSVRSQTIATITYQNFFRLFDKLSGMTGTAENEAEEFRKVYGMEVEAIPPYKKLIRKDRRDLIFWDKESKYKMIIKVIKENKENSKRPILIGSPSVEFSESLSELLFKEKIDHYKLNAINHQQEAEIISKAGKLGSITISTNMAGRGTDKVLSDESKKAGGLLVVGVERNPNRRIDDQLKGRSGRQGDPGESCFYVSLEDDLIKNFALKEKINLFLREKSKEIFENPISGRMFDYLISEPRRKFKNSHSLNRQNVLNYDLLISKQRNFIYDYRDRLLDAKIENLEEKEEKEESEQINMSISRQNKFLKIFLLKEVDKF